MQISVNKFILNKIITNNTYLENKINNIEKNINLKCDKIEEKLNKIIDILNAKNIEISRINVKKDGNNINLNRSNYNLFDSNNDNKVNNNDINNTNNININNKEPKIKSINLRQNNPSKPSDVDNNINILNTIKNSSLIQNQIQENNNKITLITPMNDSQNLNIPSAKPALTFKKLRQTYEILNDSNVFTSEEQLDLINSELIKIMGKNNFRYNYVYSLSEDEDRNQFHNYVDECKNTVVVFKTEEGNIFGGFTNKDWSKSSTKKKDDDAFVFSFVTNKTYKIKKGKEAIYTGGNGPQFCSDESFMIYLKNDLKEGHTTEVKNSYFDGITTNFEINGGKWEFTVEEIEIYEIA